jgi:Hypothetical protein FLILHELTA
MEPPPPRLPGRLKPYTAAIQKLSLRTGTPLPSLIISFGILHEVTAIVPLVGLYWGARVFGIGDQMTAYLSPRKASQRHQPITEGLDDASSAGGWFNEKLRKYTKEGERRVARVGAKYGILGFTKGQKITEEDMQRLGGRVASEVANGAFAYMVVKVSNVSQAIAR